VLPLLNAPLRAAAFRLPRLQRQQAEPGVASPSEPDGLLRHTALKPFSPFAESFRSIKVAADIGGADQKNRVIGVTSTMPNEGKSTVASNLAELIAHVGKKVILIDGDLRNPSISRILAPDATGGLLEVLAGKIELHDAVRAGEGSGRAFLPTVIESRLAHSSELLGSDSLKILIARLRGMYDYVIVDLPPLGPVAEVRATADMIDSYVYVVQWGRLRKSAVQQQLLGAPEIYDRLLGVVLNKVDLRAFRRHEPIHTGYNQHGYY
jgi:capsular exopolysaccharide synthesis family protein